MVRVVSDKPEKTKECVCPKCCYRLAYTGEDVTSKSYTDYGGGSDIYQFITCPRTTCGEKIQVQWP